MSYVATFWQSDPLAGVINFGSGGLLAWVLLAVLVGMVIASLREHADA